MPRFVYTSTGASSTVGCGQYIADWRMGMPNPPTITVTCVPTTSNATFNAEWSNDYGSSVSTFTSSLANWFVSSNISAVSGNSYAVFNWPVTAVRLNVTAYTSSPSVTMTVVQQG